MSKHIELGKYRHMKSGNEYVVVNTHVINATNGDQDGVVMVLYYSDDARPIQLFVREYQEFKERFTPVI